MTDLGRSREPWRVKGGEPLKKFAPSTHILIESNRVKQSLSKMNNVTEDYRDFPAMLTLSHSRSRSKQASPIPPLSSEVQRSVKL